MCIKVSCFRRVQNKEKISFKRSIRRYHFKLEPRLLLFFYLNDWLLETGDDVSLVIRFRVDFNIDAVPGVLLSEDVELFGEACGWFWSCCCCWGSDPFLGEVIFGLANCATRWAGFGLISGLGSRLVIGLNLPEKWLQIKSLFSVMGKSSLPWCQFCQESLTLEHFNKPSFIFVNFSFDTQNVYVLVANINRFAWWSVFSRSGRKTSQFTLLILTLGKSALLLTLLLIVLLLTHLT